MTNSHILLVEDDYEQGILFMQVLQMSGYTVEMVTDAGEAQARLLADGFALLLADWDLTGAMRGDELIRWARAHDPAIKTILYSNHPQVGEIAAACGADAAFRKMEGIGELRRLVRELAPLPTDHA